MSMVKPAALSVAAGLVGQGALIVSGITTARLLGVEGRGLLTILLVAPAVAASIGAIGVPAALVHFASRDDSYKTKYIAAARDIFLIQGLVLSILYGLALTYSGYSSDLVTTIASIAVLQLVLLNEYLLSIAQSDQNFKLVNIIRVAPLTFYSVSLLLLLTATSPSLKFVLLCWIAAYAGFLCPIAWRYWHPASMRRIPGTWSEGRNLILYGVKGHVGAVSPYESWQLDKFAVAYLYSPVALGLYVVAQSFANLPRIVVTSMVLVAAPRVSAALAPTALANAKAYGWSALTAIVAVTSIVMVLLPIAVPLLFGQQFAPAVSMATIIVPGAAIAAMRKFLTDMARSMGAPAVGTVIELLMLVMFALLFFFCKGKDIELLLWGIFTIQAATLIATVLILSFIQTDSKIKDEA